jgi:hypothetical protein
MGKIYRFLGLGLISFSGASGISWLASLYEQEYTAGLKLLLAITSIILVLMTLILDDAIAHFIGVDSDILKGVVAVGFSSAFIGAAFRAFALEKILEGTLLITSVAFIWGLMLVLVIKILLLARETK